MVRYEGGKGASFKDAIIIKGAINNQEGVKAEYQYINSLYGKRGVDWEFAEQSFVEKENRDYDILQILIFTSGKQKKLFYFNITEFFGKYDGMFGEPIYTSGTYN